MEELRKDTNIILSGYGISYAAMWKRMLYNEKKSYANVIPEICKETKTWEKSENVLNEWQNKKRRDWL